MQQDEQQAPSFKERFDLSRVIFHAKFEVNAHAIKKNSRSIFRNRATGKHFLGKTNQLRQAENSMVLRLRRFGTFNNSECPTRAALWCVFIFTFSDYFTKKGVRSKRLGDLSNLYQLPEDALQQAGVIADDDQIEAHDFSGRFPGEKNTLEIFVFPLEYLREIQSSKLGIDQS